MDKDVANLKRMLEYIEKIEKYSDMDEKAFFNDEKSLHATIFCLAQLGEIVSKISDEIKRK